MRATGIRHLDRGSIFGLSFPKGICVLLESPKLHLEQNRSKQSLQNGDGSIQLWIQSVTISAPEKSGQHHDADRSK
jgi:hypothetical protein